MKKNIAVVLLVACLLPFCFSVAHANEGYSVHPRQALPENIILWLRQIVMEGTELQVLDCDPTEGYVDYVSWVSYDYLSQISTNKYTAGVIVYNATMDAYFIRVSFIPTVSLDGEYEYAALGTVNGYVLGAQASTVDLGDTNSLLDAMRRNIKGLWAQVTHIDSYLQSFCDVIVACEDYITSALHLLVGQNGLLDTWFRTFDTDLGTLINWQNTLSLQLNDAISAIQGISVDGGDVSLDFTNINVKLDELFASLEVTIKGAADHSRIISQLSYIVSQLQYGGASPSGAWHPTTIYDYIQGIYSKMGSGGGGGGTVSDGSLIYNAIKDFQVDFDNTFSDLQQIYPTEKVEQISSGAFDWNNGIDILNSVTASDKLATTTIYRLPETTLNVTENSGTFRIDNDGNPLPVSVNLSYDNASHNLSTYAINETKTVTGTDIIITDAYPTTPVSLKLYGQSQQNGTPTPSNPVPIYGGLENGNPYVYMYKGSDDSYKYTIDASFVNVETPLHGIPVSSGGNYTDENGQQWLCDVVDFNAGTYTKYIGKLVIDGVNLGCHGAEVVLTSGLNYSLIWFDTLRFSNPAMMTSVGSSVCRASIEGVIAVWLPDSLTGVTSADTMSTLTDKFNAYLSNHPVTVLYVLDEPEVYQAFEVYGNGTLDSSYTRINMGDFVNLPISVTYTIGNPYTALYSDADGNWYKQRNDGSSTKITDSRVDTLNAAFNYKQYDNAADIKFNAGTNIIQVSNGDLTVDYIKGSKFFNWLYLYLNNFNQPGVVGLSDVLERMDTIIELLSGSVGIGRCDHNYSSEMNQAPSCALPGLQTFTCSNCGSSYSEIIPSTGHDWRCTDHVADELDPDTGEVFTAGYDIYTCSICGDTYNDYGGTGAPDTQSDTVTGIISRVFEKLGTLAGDLIAMVIRMLDKLLAGFDDLVTDFNTKTEQIVSFGGDYPMWLAGVWAIIPEDLMLALGFCVVVAILGILGKKLVFS